MQFRVGIRRIVYFCAPMAEKTNKQEQEWFKGLQHEDQDEVLKTIEQIAKKGNKKLIRPLLDCMLEQNAPSVDASVTAVLSDVKDDELGPILFTALAEEKFTPYRAKIVAIIWNAGVSLNGHLELLAQIGIEGGFEEQIEVVTALDNYTGEFEEEEIMNALIDSRELIRAKGDASELQQQILQKLQILERFD